MAHPMIEWLLDTRYRAPARRARRVEQSVIVFGAMEATLTPLMEDDRARAIPASRCSACRASTTRSTGRHIELGVKGEAQAVAGGLCGSCALAWLHSGPTLGPELVR